MSVWSNYIVLIIISSLILAGIGVVALVYAFPWLKRKKVGNVDHVIEFIKQLDKTNPLKNITVDNRALRENDLINSGFTLLQIEKAQELMQKEAIKQIKLKEYKQNGNTNNISTPTTDATTDTTSQAPSPTN